MAYTVSFSWPRADVCAHISLTTTLSACLDVIKLYMRAHNSEWKKHDCYMKRRIERLSIVLREGNKIGQKNT
jgi:hypothetical protein